MSVDIRASATIGGKRTNRIKVKRAPASAGTALRRFKKDPLTRGHDIAVVAISIPVGELAAIDVVCERVQMARSHLLREAAKLFMARLK